MKPQNTDKATARPWILDRTTCKGYGAQYVHIVQDGEGEDANEIMRVLSDYNQPSFGTSKSEAVVDQLLREHNEHSALKSFVESIAKMDADYADRAVLESMVATAKQLTQA